MDSEPKHYQRAIPAPRFHLNLSDDGHDLLNTTFCPTLSYVDLDTTTEVLESKNTCTYCLTRFSISLGRIGYAVESLWSDEANDRCILSDQSSEE